MTQDELERDQPLSPREIADLLGMPERLVLYYRDRFAAYVHELAADHSEQFSPEAMAALRRVAQSLANEETIPPDRLGESTEDTGLLMPEKEQVRALVEEALAEPVERIFQEMAALRCEIAELAREIRKRDRPHDLDLYRLR